MLGVFYLAVYHEFRLPKLMIQSVLGPPNFVLLLDHHAQEKYKGKKTNCKPSTTKNVATYIYPGSKGWILSLEKEATWC